MSKLSAKDRLGASRKPPRATPRKTRTAARERSDTSISLRVPESVLGLITTAATVLGKSRTEFMLESARQNATDVLLDQRLFDLTPDHHAAFMAVLADPPAPNAALKKLMASAAPWEA